MRKTFVNSKERLIWKKARGTQLKKLPMSLSTLLLLLHCRCVFECCPQSNQIRIKLSVAIPVPQLRFFRNRMTRIRNPWESIYKSFSQCFEIILNSRAGARQRVTQIFLSSFFLYLYVTRIAKTMQKLGGWFFSVHAAAVAVAQKKDVRRQWQEMC